MFTAITDYKSDGEGQGFFGEMGVYNSSSQPSLAMNTNTTKSALDPQIRPSSNTKSPQIPRARPSHSHSMHPTNVNRMQSGVRSPAPRPSANQIQSGVPPTARHMRPVKSQVGQSLANSSSSVAGKRMTSPNVRPTVARPYRPMNTSSSSRAPDDI